jgi:hypothetical protein
MLEAHWRPEGYTSPNLATYPWQWLWDSCFHAIAWAEAGDDRAVVELATVFAGQDPDTGFVPHMGYQRDPDHDAAFWGRRGFSSITQPPMYGHAVAELLARGVAVPDEVVERAAAGLRFLTGRRRRSPGGLVELVHPWESGADDSIRWDDLVGGSLVTPVERHRRKGELLAAVVRDGTGCPLANDAFAVGAASFTALVAFNAAELAGATGDDALAAAARELSEALGARWDPGLVTWVDDGPTARSSGRARSVEALLGALVDPDPAHVEAALASLVDAAAHGATYGPTGVHRAEAAYSPTTYWRGPAWPQLGYLLWVAADRHGRPEVAARLATCLVDGAVRSGLAEYRHPDTAAPGGAVPQSWTALAWVVAEAGVTLRAGRPAVG